MRQKIFTTILLVILATGMVQAQTLQNNYGAPAQPVNVGNGAVNFKIRINGGAGVCAGPSALTVTLPPGFVYVPGSSSVTGGTGSVTETSATGNTAVLSVSNIPASPDSTVITYLAYAGCGVIGGTGTTITYNLAGCAAPVTASATVNALSAQLNFTAVTNASFTAATGSVYTRDYTIRNDGYGAIDTFYIDSKNGAGIEHVGFSPTANITLTTVISGSDTIYRYRIVKAGGFLTGQTFTLTETLRIKCASGASLQGELKTWFGYGGAECTAVSNTYTVGAGIDPNFRPLLTFTPINAGGPLCRGTAVSDTILIVNTGTAAAVLPRFYISSNNNEYPASGIDFFNYAAGATTNFGLPGGTAVLGIDMTSVQFKLGANGAWSNVAADSIVNQGTVPSSNGTPLANSCFDANDKAGVFVHLPTMQPGDTVYFSFREKNCNYTDCQADYQGALNLGAEYGDACNNRLRTFYWRFASSNSGTLTPTDVPTDVNAGDVFSLSYNISAQAQQYYLTAGGKLRFVITLPAAFTWTGNLSDVTYLAPCYIPYDATVSYDPVTHIIIYEFTPIIASTCMLSAYIQFNNVSVIPTAVSGNVTVAHEADIKHMLPCTDYYKLSCGQSPPIRIHGSTPGPCTGLVPTGVIARRTNYGEPDNNNDGITDPAGSLDMNLVKTRFVMTGDTLEITFKGKIAVNGLTPAGGFKYGTISTAYTAYTEKMQPLNATVSLYNAAGALTGSENMSFTLTGGTSTVGFSIDDLKDLSPGRTTFLDNDSIVIKKYFKIIPQDPAAGNDNGDFLTQVNLNNTFYVSDVANATGTDQYSCDNYGGQFTMVSHRVVFHVDRSYTTGCTQGGIYVHVYSLVGGGAPFIYEHRATMILDTLKITLAPGLTFVNSNFVPLDPSATPLVFVTSPITPAQATSETTDYLFYVEALAKCDVPPATSLLNTFEAVYRKMPLFDSPVTMQGASWFDVHKTTLTIESPGITKTITGAAVNWDIQINNLDVQANTGLNGTVPNLWIARNGVSGIVIDSIQTLSGPGGTSAGLMTAVNGIYQAGTLTENTTKYFRIFAHSTNCGIDSLEVIFGYKCDAYPAGLTAALANCPKGIKLYVTGQTAALQLSIISQPSGNVDLCQELPYEVEVLNSGLGDGKHLTVVIPFPASGGLEYVAGSYGIKYPVSAGSYTPLSDANVTVTGSSITFTIPDGTFPLNFVAGSDRVRIQFKLRPVSCNFTSGQKLSFKPLGENACDFIISGTAQTTGKIQLNGAPADLPSFTIVSSADSVLACGSGPVSTHYKFKIINTGGFTTTAADGFRIVLPAPWTMDPASDITYTHDPAGLTVLSSSGGVYDFKTGAGLAIGDSIVLDATIYAPNAAALACGNGSSPVAESGFVRFSVTCISTGVPCTTSQLLDGENMSTFIFVKRPSYSITSLTGAAAADPVSGTPNTNVAGQFTIVNANNTFVAQNAVLNLYKDVNQNGIYDAGDLFINSGSFPLSAGTSQTFSYNFTKPTGMAGDICPLVAVLTLDCNCSPATFSLNCNFVLPVKLESFTAAGKDCKALLSWKTTSEINFSRFEVEYSNNGTAFMNAGTVKSANNINGSTYKFTYVQPDAKGYYRLKMVDLDGRFEYSKIVSVNVDCNERIIAVSPNPTNGLVTVTGLKSGDYLQIYSIEGKLLLKKAITGTQVQVDLTNYSSDVFTVSVLKKDGTVTTAKVIKIR